MNTLNPRRWAILPKWDELPEFMKNDEVRPYYDILSGHRASMLLKRILDIILGILVLLILAIPMLVIAILIKMDSTGPVFYRQERITTYGNIFRIHKFRTMITDADKIGPEVTSKEDKRITRIGHSLRKYRLDEFPQVFDVILGNMSFVGTRPEAVKYVKEYSPKMMATLLLPAGITSEASIRFKDEAELLKEANNVDLTYIEKVLPQKMEWNLWSINQFSILQDVKVMFRTLHAVL